MKPQTTEDGQSYQRQVVPLHRDISSRAGNLPNKDETFQNVFFETVHDKSINDNRMFVLKRAGTAPVVASVASSDIRGMFFWKDQNKVLYCVGQNVYVYDLSTSSSTTLSTVFTTTTGDVGFTSYLYDDATVVVCASDGTKLVKIDTSNVVTPCVDADLPSPHNPFILFCDGYLLLIKSGTADVYNSDLNDPMAWTPGNFITAEMNPDLLVRLVKINNYVVAFGTESVEYFFDAGNATGSPFSRNDSPVKLNSYLGGLSQYGNDIVYVGKQVTGETSIFMLKDFRVEELGTPTISRYLNFVSTDPATWKGAVISAQGNSFYMLNAGTYTYVYGFGTKLWVKWAYQQEANFPIGGQIQVNYGASRNSYFYFLGSNDSTIYKFDDGLMQDNGVNYTCRITTEQSDFGNLNRKSMSRLSIKGDRTPVESNINIFWTDDDYQNWNGPAVINLNQDSQTTYRLGTFRQRAFKLEYTDQYILRLEYLECDVNKGIS